MRGLASKKAEKESTIAYTDPGSPQEQEHLLSSAPKAQKAMSRIHQDGRGPRAASRGFIRVGHHLRQSCQWPALGGGSGVGGQVSIEEKGVLSDSYVQRKGGGHVPAWWGEGSRSPHSTVWPQRRRGRSDPVGRKRRRALRGRSPQEQVRDARRCAIL